MGEVIVSMKDIVKTFPGVKALDHVNFELRSGEVMALLGENGAGKSTLMKILSGVYTKDSGTMTIFGTEYDNLTPKQAQTVGVAIIHQELNMCRHLSVTENMFLGREKVNGHKHQKDLIHSLIPVINVSVMDRMALRLRKLFLSRFPKDLFRDFNRVLTADPHDSDS